MRRPALALLFAALIATPFAPMALADETPPLCKALRGLGDEARKSGQPQRVSAEVALAAPAGCRPVTDSAATRAFCDEAAHAAGLAWRIYDCENTLSADTKVTTSGERAEGRSRKAITHLTAKLAHGDRIDLNQAGGRYDIVVWAPM